MPATVDRLKSKIAIWVALGAIITFAVLVRYMLIRVDAPEPDWSRMVFIFGGVEALAFAGFGFFVGREVNRQRADSAEQRAEQAEES